MFTKELITELFTKRNGQNFIIKTNEGVGQGINGIDFTSYIGARRWEDNFVKYYIKSTIIELESTYMVLKTETNKGWMRGTKEFIVPYDSITSIVFLIDVTNGYPMAIEKNELFN